MYHYAYPPPPLYPVTPVITPIGLATHVPLPPSPYRAHVALPGPVYDPYAYGVPPSYPYYHQGTLPVAAPPPQFPPHASQLHGLLHYARIPRLRFDVAKPLEPLIMLNGSRVSPVCGMSTVPSCISICNPTAS